MSGLRASALAALVLVAASVGQASAPITNGSADDADDGVVGLVSDTGINCTGTLVAPRVVVTAAHCLVSTAVTSIVIGADRSSGVSVPVVHTRVHPDFDSSLLANDVGLVLLGTPAPAAPWPMLAVPFDPSFTGRGLRLVGFGQTSPTDLGGARKRQGTAMIGSFTAADFEILAAPSLTCGGDSGGPAFLTLDATEYLAGITSAGDADCARFTRSTRADVQLSFVAAFVAETEAGTAGPGRRCFYPDHCPTGRCVFPSDAPRIGYCSAACEQDGDCVNGMYCPTDPAGSRECRYPEPSPGALGSPCGSYTDCDSLLCARSAPGAPGSCSVVCDVEVASCPSGFECRPDADQAALQACFRPDGGGCSSARAGGRPFGDAVAYLFLLVVLARLRAMGRIRYDDRDHARELEPRT